MGRRIQRLIAFLRRSEPPRPVSAWSLTMDALIAVVATAVAIAAEIGRGSAPSGAVRYYPLDPVQRIISGTPVYPSVATLAGVAMTAAPLAFRRRYPLSACAVILAAIIVTRGALPTVTFGSAVLAVYSAVVYSPFRQLVVGAVLTGGIICTITFPDTLPNIPVRYTALIVMVPTLVVGLGMREWRRRAGDSAARLRRAQADHEAATRRAIEEERARIAAELHDVVTHNVSVMMVQAGAARQVLQSSPGDAREALLAVEGSGRTAMTELRNLLGLLCPEGDDVALRPQPGLADLGALIERVSAAGLDVKLHTSGFNGDLPPGLDLAAYRVVQEGLTNVMKHAGQAPAIVRLSSRLGELVITVSDNGTCAGAAAVAGRPASGRGLIGLRERLALYGGSVDAGPRPGGGWRLRARVPLELLRAQGLFGTER
jgi:signal transduction histidine kinase